MFHLLFELLKNSSNRPRRFGLCDISVSICFSINPSYPQKQLSNKPSAMTPIGCSASRAASGESVRRSNMASPVSWNAWSLELQCPYQAFQLKKTPKCQNEKRNDRNQPGSNISSHCPRSFSESLSSCDKYTQLLHWFDGWPANENSLLHELDKEHLTV